MTEYLERSQENGIMLIYIVLWTSLCHLGSGKTLEQITNSFKMDNMNFGLILLAMVLYVFVILPILYNLLDCIWGDEMEQWRSDVKRMEQRRHMEEWTEYMERFV